LNYPHHYFILDAQSTYCNIVALQTLFELVNARIL